MDPFAWVILVLAVSAIGDTWHWGSIFSNWRGWIEAHKPVLWAEWLSCPFCFSHTLSLLVFLTYLIACQNYAWCWWILVVLSIVKGASLLRTYLPIDVSSTTEFVDE